jgi:hypothetical protein
MAFGRGLPVRVKKLMIFLSVDVATSFAVRHFRYPKGRSPKDGDAVDLRSLLDRN